VPYAATTVLAFGLVGLDPATNHWPFAAAVLLTCICPALVALLPWGSIPAWVRLVPIAAFLLGTWVLRHSAGGTSSGTGVISLLPICWLALHGSRRELAAGLIGLAAYWALPVVLIGGAQYPVSQLRTAVMYVAVASMIGLTVQGLVTALAAHAGSVARVARAARSVLSAADAREEVCAAACDVSGASFSVLFEPTGDGRLHSTAMAGIAVAPMLIEMGLGRSATWVAYGAGHPVFARDASTNPGVNSEMWAAHGSPSSMLFEPVQRGDRTVGVLVVGWARRVADVRSSGPALIGLLAAEAASAIAHADLVDRLGELAATDPLTGLPNRRTWNRALDRALHGQADGAGVFVAMLDLDHFKAFNDEHGHLAGDRQLKASAVAWQSHLRPGDVLARLGGEEFAVLLEGCTLTDAVAVMERLRNATPGGETCSAGLVVRGLDEPAEALMARADAALYAAKRAGRDQLAAVS
jgi:diguanylate cyclase (GGDEF)-like protein